MLRRYCDAGHIDNRPHTLIEKSLVVYPFDAIPYFVG
jgi:hypothetical protein